MIITQTKPYDGLVPRGRTDESDGALYQLRRKTEARQDKELVRDSREFQFVRLFVRGCAAPSSCKLGQRAPRHGEQCYLPGKGDAAPLSWAQPIQILPPNVLEVRAVS